MSTDGGPAFPTDNEQQTGNTTWHFAGMSLRDYFAAKALPLAFEIFDSSADFQVKPDHLATCVYQIADAMLAERSKP